MAIRITKVYTRRGVQLIDGAVGVDELNAAIGVVRAENGPAVRSTPACRTLDGILRTLQSELFDLGAELATPPAAFMEGMFTTGDAQVTALEHIMDRCQQDLTPLESFILPGGGRTSALLHVARTVCRRAERDVWRLMRRETIGNGPLRYLNRLSDLLFVLSRWIGHQRGEREYLWERPLERERQTRARRTAAKPKAPAKRATGSRR